MLLSVLVPCLESRAEACRALTGEVLRQVYAAGLGGQIEVLTEVDDGSVPSGVKRNALTARSTGEYLCFLDDDDQVSPDYVSSLAAGCRVGVDVVSFDLRFSRTDRPNYKEVWRFGDHVNDRGSGNMCVNHLCAWRRPVATKCSWCPRLGYGDDHLWFQPLYHAGLVRTHYHIDKVLYHYIYDPRTTANQKRDRIDYGRNYVGRGLRCWRDRRDGTILIEDGTQYTSEVLVRRPDGGLQYLSIINNKPYHTVRTG